MTLGEFCLDAEAFHGLRRRFLTLHSTCQQSRVKQTVVQKSIYPARNRGYGIRLVATKLLPLGRYFATSEEEPTP